jgi:hypothetical protein
MFLELLMQNSSFIKACILMFSEKEIAVLIHASVSTSKPLVPEFSLE